MHEKIRAFFKTNWASGTNCILGSLYGQGGLCERTEAQGVSHKVELNQKGPVLRRDGKM